MDLTLQQRRDLIALWCHVAWADGVVKDAERVRIADLFARMGEGAVRPEELERWLVDGPPDVSGQLPESAKRVFQDEAIRIISADKDLDPAELSAVRDMLTLYFGKLEDLVVG